MPTAYTSLIEKGMVKNAKQFLHLCLREFEGCIAMNDALDPNKDYTPEIMSKYQDIMDYHQDLLDKSKKRLKDIQDMTDDEICERYIKETERDINNLKHLQVQDLHTYTKYMKIRDEIEKWDCSKKFHNLKEFALKQIDKSVDKSSYYEYKLSNHNIPTREGYEKVKDEYIHSLTSSAQWSIDYHTKEIDRFMQLRNESLKNYSEFKDELEKLK